jgi:hypothetical protein
MRTAPDNKMALHPALCNCPFCRPPSMQPERDAVAADETVQRLAVIAQTARRRFETADEQWVDSVRELHAAQFKTYNRPAVFNLDTMQPLVAESKFMAEQRAEVRRLEALVSELRRSRDQLHEFYAQARLEHDAASRAVVRRLHELGNIRGGMKR